MAGALGVWADLRSRRGLAITLLFAGAAVLLVFSFAAGFSIGRDTALLPVLYTGYLASLGGGSRGAWLAVAALIYLLFSWLFAPMVVSFPVLWPILGAWGILLYAALAVMALLFAALRYGERA